MFNLKSFLLLTNQLQLPFSIICHKLQVFPFHTSCSSCKNAVHAPFFLHLFRVTCFEHVPRNQPTWLVPFIIPEIGRDKLVLSFIIFFSRAFSTFFFFSKRQCQIIVLFPFSLREMMTQNLRIFPRTLDILGLTNRPRFCEQHDARTVMGQLSSLVLHSLSRLNSSFVN